MCTLQSMYFIYLFLITILLPLTLTACPYYCFQKRYTRWSLCILFTAILVPTLLYRLVCPIYNGAVYTQLSENRDPLQKNTVRPWGDTFTCKVNTVERPKTVSDVQNIVATADKVRVVGAGHSFSPLICTDSTLITLSDMNNVKEIKNNEVTVEAGISIEMLQEVLIKENKIIHGFGSIQDQNVAGAFMTSHHGLQYNSFAENVKSLKIVTASGNVEEIHDLFMYRASMGMLGVVVEMTIRTFPNTFVEIQQSKMSLEDAISKLQTGVAGIIETNYNQRNHGYLKLMVERDVVNTSITYPVQTDQWSSVTWDTFVVPLTVLWPWLSTFPLLDFANDKITVKPIVQAWTHHSEYGMMYSAYAVPLENCSKVILAMDSKPYDHHVSTILIRFLKGQKSTTCLTFAPEDSCVIDVYDIQTQPNLLDFHEYLEGLVHDHGGYSHWGKFYAGDMTRQTKMSCMAEFRLKQQEVDPKEKFLNDFTKEIIVDNFDGRAMRYGNTFKDYRMKTVVYQIAFIICITAYCYTCIFKRRRNDYKLLS